MVLKSSPFLTPFNRQIITNINSNNNNSNREPVDEEEEFNECDVVWSPTFEDEPSTTTTAATTAVEIPAISPTTSAGLSTALLDPGSPSSIQRKTTSSPVSMISSSLGRGDGPGLGGCYYGRRFHQSAPVNVPVWPNRFKKSEPGFGLARFDEVDDSGYDDDEGGEMVPPHEIVARSHGATSFSVFEGAGRTLKGRDLTTVRNSVFQKTGFIE